jgi:hypothetical protein
MNRPPNMQLRPAISFFFKPNPFHLEYVEEDDIRSRALYDVHNKTLVDESGVPLWATLSKKFPTSVYTLGKTRPAGYSRTGKYLPSKYIPGKMDKRSGK